MTDKYPSKVLQQAVEAISVLPGVGRRSALRLALHLLNQPRENVHHFATAINNLADEVHYCRDCMMISDGEVCSICSDMRRDHNTICVVESVRDVMSIEATGQYRGVYHVLGGIISPIAGIGPSDLRIRELVERLSLLSSLTTDSSSDSSAALSGSAVSESSVPASGSVASDSSAPAFGSASERPEASVVEVIMALSGDVEGETTAFYIYRQIERFRVKVTSLARGLSFGDDLEYADSLTLGRSIVNRQIFKP